MTRWLRKRSVPMMVVVLALVAAACGGTPDEEQAAEGTPAPESTEAGVEASAAPTGGGVDGLEAVYAQVEGLTGDERRAALIELALAEGSDLTFYTSTNVDESGPITEAFEEQTGIAVNLFRSNAGSIMQRVLQESAAGFAGVDVLNVSGPEMTILDHEGLLAPLRTPATEGNAAVSDNWAGIYLNTFIAAWNTDRISPEEAPTTWEEVFTKYPGEMVFQLQDFDWFATLITEWFVKEQGMTEEEAIELFKQGAAGNQVIDGHTLGAELLAAGEFSVASSLYQHRMARMQAENAPIEWEPAVQPLIIRPNTIAIHRDTTRPATALLLTEFMLTDAQPMLAEFERTPALRTVEGGVPEEYDPIPVNLELLFEEQEKWMTIYEELVRASGDPDIEQEE